MATSLGNKRVLADNLNRLLHQKNMTRHELSDALDIPYSTLCSWCNGTLYPRIDRIEMLATFFGVSKSDLVETPDDALEDRLEKAFRGRADMKTLFKLANKLDPKELKAVITTLENLTGDNGSDNS